MSFNVQQIDIDLLKQGEKKILVRLELLNNNYKTIQELSGELQQDSYTINTDSNIRRNYELDIVIKDKAFSIDRDKYIWLDRYIRIFIGLYSSRVQSVRWYPMGIYVPTSINFYVDGSSNYVSLSCSDKMVEFTGDRNGELSGLFLSIPVEVETDEGIVKNTIRSAMIDTVIQLGGISKYRIDQMGSIVNVDGKEIIDDAIPYDLEFATGSTVWDVIKTLRDLYPGWETFFENETFICQQIPTHLNDPIVLDEHLLEELVISEENNYDFTEIYNVTEIWGKALDSNYYTDNVSMNVSGVYTLNYGTVTQLSSNLKFAFKASDDNLANASIRVDNYQTYPIICEGNVPIPSNRIQKGNSYVVRFIQTGSSGYFYFMGQHQVSAITKLVSKYPDANKIQYDLLNEPTHNISYIVQSDSPFCSDFNDVGEIRHVLSGGEFDDIYSDELALQRAEYENWKSTDLLNTITLTMVDILWLDVNQKIRYRSKATGDVDTYIVKTKSGSSTGSTMSITCVKFQPLYPWYR